MTPQETLFLVAAVAFGLTVGSFLNVVIARYPYDERTVRSPRRSICLGCERQLAWYENLPVLSWLVLRGRCRTCRARISWRYPFVELVNAGLWGLAAWQAGLERWPLFLVWAVALSALIVCTFVDFDHWEIPDELSIPGMWLAPVVSFALPELHRHTWIAQRFSEGESVDRVGALLASLAGIFTGWGVLRAMDWVGRKLIGKDAMGWGDAKLLGAGGGLIGPGGAMTALLIASFVGSIAGIANMVRWFCYLRTRSKARGQGRSLGELALRGRHFGRYLPFGPYLALGIGIVLLAWNHVSVLLDRFVVRM
ncbi:MAG: prepilin peptidase [Planctomycetota bacterium]